MRWLVSHRADPLARALADRHYNRQKVGATQFVPPGRCLVLRTAACDALWFVDPRQIRSTNPGCCFLIAGFRNKCSCGRRPDRQRKRDTSICRKCGGTGLMATEGGLPAFHLAPPDMPAPASALRVQGELLGGAA